MTRPAWDDLDPFVSLDDFAVPVLLELQDGTSRAVAGIFDDPYLNTQLGEYEPDVTQPRVTAKASDLEGVTRGDLAVIGGVTYDVMGAPQPDGTGMALLRLSER